MTGNGGTTWKGQASGSSASLTSVASFDGRHGWAAGDRGTILVTADGGTTWKPQASGSATDLGAVGFADAEHGRVVGSGLILVTVTGGDVPRPIVLKLTPSAGRRESKVTITGLRFRDARGHGCVRFGGKRCSAYLSWSDARIVCRVPAKARAGKVRVTVTTTAGRSNGRTFKVKLQRRYPRPMSDVVGTFAPDTSEAGRRILCSRGAFCLDADGRAVSQLVVIDYLLQGYLVGVSAHWRERLLAGIERSPAAPCVTPSTRGYRWKDDASRSAFWRRCLREGRAYDGPRVFRVAGSSPTFTAE